MEKIWKEAFVAFVCKHENHKSHVRLNIFTLKMEKELVFETLAFD
jgi:hypothetical protein